ncbi:MAG: hypothetical protein R2710_12625 [Acidimicrobiales bacterium]
MGIRRLATIVGLRGRRSCSSSSGDAAVDTSESDVDRVHHDGAGSILALVGNLELAEGPATPTSHRPRHRCPTPPRRQWRAKRRWPPSRRCRRRRRPDHHAPPDHRRHGRLCREQRRHRVMPPPCLGPHAEFADDLTAAACRGDPTASTRATARFAALLRRIACSGSSRTVRGGLAVLGAVATEFAADRGSLGSTIADRRVPRRGAGAVAGSSPLQAITSGIWADSTGQRRVALCSPFDWRQRHVLTPSQSQSAGTSSASPSTPSTPCSRPSDGRPHVAAGIVLQTIGESFDVHRSAVRRHSRSAVRRSVAPCATSTSLAATAVAGIGVTRTWRFDRANGHIPVSFDALTAFGNDVDHQPRCHRALADRDRRHLAVVPGRHRARTGAAPPISFGDLIMLAGLMVIAMPVVLARPEASTPTTCSPTTERVTDGAGLPGLGADAVIDVHDDHRPATPWSSSARPVRHLRAGVTDARVGQRSIQRRRRRRFRGRCAGAGARWSGDQRRPVRPSVPDFDDDPIDLDELGGRSEPESGPQ